MIVTHFLYSINWVSDWEEGLNLVSGFTVENVTFIPLTTFASMVVLFTNRFCSFTMMIGCQLLLSCIHVWTLVDVNLTDVGHLIKAVV